MLTIAPLPAASFGRACAQQRAAPVRLIAIVCSNSAGSCSTPRRIVPAQLTSTSSRGRLAISARTPASSRTSSGSASRAVKPGAARAASHSAWVAPVTVTTAPTAASASATAAPMPLVPPVTSATRPARTSLRNVEDMRMLLS